MSEYGIGLSPEEPNPEHAVEQLVNFLPVLAYDGSHMTPVDAGAILDIALAGTSATLLARKGESAILVNVDNDTLRKIMANEAAMAAVMNIEGFRALGSDVFETVVNKSEKVKATKKDKGDDLTKKERKELTGLPRVEGTSDLACLKGRPGRMLQCLSPIRRSSATMS